MICKDVYGCSRSPPTSTLPTCPPGSPISKDSWSRGREGSFIGSLLSTVEDQEDLDGFETALDQFTQNSHAQPRPKNTFGKKIQACQEQDSNLEANPFDVTEPKTGMPSGILRLEVNSLPYLPTYEYVAILRSRRSMQTLYNQWLWSEAVQFFGVCVNMQTSFMHPPFGFALFYLRGISDTSFKSKSIPKKIESRDIYLGSIPWVILQLLLVVIVIFFPQTVTIFLDKKEVVDLNQIKIEIAPEDMLQAPQLDDQKMMDDLFKVTPSKE